MSHTIEPAKQDKQSNFNSNQSSRDTPPYDTVSAAPSSGLSDTDYEFLFNQLLEGIAHGWNDRRIVKFFQQLGSRGSQVDWIAWLERLRGKLLKLPVESKRQLGTMMIRLGELTQSASEVNQIGETSHQIGRELLFGNNVAAEIWEYVGADLPSSLEFESEQELSRRLPSNFAALGTDLNSEAASNTHSKEDRLDSQDEIVDSVKSTDAAEIKLNSSSEPALAAENLDSQSDLWDSEPKIDSALDNSDKSVSEATGARQISSEPNSPTVDLKRNTESARELDSSHKVNSVNELEFKPDSPFPADEENISTQDLATSENTSKLDKRTESPSKQPNADANRLSTALEAFDLEAAPQDLSEEEPLNISAQMQPESIQEAAELVQLRQQIAASQNQENQQDLTISKPNILETQELDDSSLEVIESWFNLGLKQVSAGEYAKAIAFWDKALTINANLAEAWHNRGSALGRLGNYDAAVKSFENALKIDPDNYQAWNDRAHALYQLQNWSDAVESWTQAIAIMPGNHLFWYNRGCALEQLSQWSDAISSYEKALEIKPDFTPGRSRYINLIADDSRPN